jgi:hypothetical protein
MIFFTAGEAVRHVFPGHVPYAEKFGVWRRGIAAFKAPLEEVWKPYLDSQGTRDEALAELVTRCGELNCYGMVDAQIASIESELLSSTIAD